MITAIVTSDNHLGAYYARLRPDRLERRRRYLQEGFRRVVDAALHHKADLFLNAGDLFDRPDPRNAERRFVAEQCRRLQDAGIPFLAIAGNHDSPRSVGYDGGVAPHEELDALGAMHLFRDSRKWEEHSLLIRGQRVRVRGMSSDFNCPAEECPLQSVAGQDKRGGDIDIALLHYGVEGWGEFPLEPFLRLSNLNSLRADAICVGHLHARNQRRLGNNALLLNPGATEHIRFGEEHLECGFWLLRCEPGHVEAEYVSLPFQPMRTLNLDLTTAESAPETLRERLEREIRQVSHSDQLLRVRLGGRLLRAHLPDLNLTAMQALGSEHNFHCQFDTEGLALYDAADDWHIDIGFSFDARQELQTVAASLLPLYADDPRQQEICRQAGRELEMAYEKLTGGAR
jgi:exonuclease SbcD